MSTNAPGIFISYSRKDEQFARKLTSSLAALGANVWLDVKDIPAGVNWSQAVQRGLTDCRLMILIVTPESMSSPNVENEWQYYLDTGKPVIPVLLRPATMHFQINRLQRINFAAGSDYQTAVGQLAGELNRLGVTLRPNPLHYAAPNPVYGMTQPQAKKPQRGRTLALGLVGLLTLACLVGGIGLALKFLTPTPTSLPGAASVPTTPPGSASSPTATVTSSPIPNPPTATPIIISPAAVTIPAADPTVDTNGTFTALQLTAAQFTRNAQINNQNNLQGTFAALTLTARAPQPPPRPTTVTPTRTPPPPPPPQTDACMQDNVIQVATNASYPPFESYDSKSGAYIGFDISLIQYIGKAEGFQVNLINDQSDTDTLLSLVSQGKYEVAISAIKIGSAQPGLVSFSNPYLTSGLSVVIRKGDKYQTVNDLQGAVIGVQKGPINEKVAASQYFKSKVIPYQFASDSMKDLLGKNIDGTVVDLPFAYYYIITYSVPLGILGPITGGEQYGIAVRSDCKQLLDTINIGLKDLMSSGNYSKMSVNWFRVDAPGGVLR